MRTKRRPLVRTLQAAGLILGSLVLCLLVTELTIRGFGLFEKERAAAVTAPEPDSPRE